MRICVLTYVRVYEFTERGIRLEENDLVMGSKASALDQGAPPNIELIDILVVYLYNVFSRVATRLVHVSVKQLYAVTLCVHRR